MLIAAAGAVALGQWSEAAAVVFLFAVAQTLEARTLERARHAVRALIDLDAGRRAGRATAPASAACRVEMIAPGAVIVVKPGEKSRSTAWSSKG